MAGSTRHFAAYALAFLICVQVVVPLSGGEFESRASGRSDPGLGWIEDVNASADSLDQKDPDMVNDSSGNLFLTYSTWDGSYYNLAIDKSTDGGASWSHAKYYNLSKNLTKPSITVDDKENILVAFMYANVNGSHDIKMGRYDKNAGTWSSAFDVYATYLDEDYPSVKTVKVGSATNIYVGFMHYSGSSWGTLLAYSINDGASWETQTVFNGSKADYSSISLDRKPRISPMYITAKKSVIVTPFTQSIVVRKVTNFNANGSVDLSAEEGVSDTTLSTPSYPVIASHSTYAVAVYLISGNVYCSYSTNSGSSWLNCTLWTNSSTKAYPDICADTDSSRFLVSWNDRAPGIYFAQANSTGLASWGSPYATNMVSKSVGRPSYNITPAIAVYGGKPAISWMDYRNGNTDIFYSTLDSTAPTNPTSYQSSHSPGVWSRDGTIDVNWTGASDTLPGRVRGYYTKWDTAANTVPTAADTMVTTGSLSNVATADGASSYLHIRTADQAGNLASGAYHVGPFKIDTTAPTNPPSISSSTPQPGIWTNDNTVSVSWPASTDATSGIAGYHVRWDNSASTVSNETDSMETSATTPSSALSNGASWYVHIRAKDVAGNLATVALPSGPYKIDTNPPSGLNVVINNGDQYTTKTQVNIGLTVVDDILSPIKEFALSEDGITWGSWQAYPANSASIATLKAPDGVKSLYFKARDEAGNEAASAASDTIALDTTPPTSKVSALPAKSGTGFSVAWSGTDATSGIATYSVQYRKGETGAWTDWQTATQSTTAQFTGAAGDTYYFRSSAIDKAGNVETQHATPDTSTTISEGIPVVVVSVTPDSLTPDQSAAVKVTVTKGGTPVEGMSVALSATGGTLGATSGTTDANGVFSTTFKSSAKGAFTITATATKTGYETSEGKATVNVAEAPSQSPLTAKLSADQVSIYSKRSCQLSVSIANGAVPTPNAQVSISSDIGSIATSSGRTDASGIFTATFTAPDVTVDTNATITVVATSGGSSAGSSIIINIKAKPTTGLHVISLAGDPSVLIGSAPTSIIKVYAESDGQPASGATLEVFTDQGTMDPATGITDASGIFVSVLHPPVGYDGPVSVRAKISAGLLSDAYTISLSVKMPPSVSIVKPITGSEVAGTTVISGTASARAVMVQVRFGTSDEWKNATGTTAWSYNWVTSDFGQITVETRAFDGYQYSAIAQAGVMVINPPVITGSPPTKNGKVSGTIAFSGTASAASSIVQYRVDNGSWASATGSAAWTFSMDTKALSKGLHLVEVRQGSGTSFSAPAERYIDVNNQVQTTTPGGNDLMLPLLLVMIIVIVVVVAVVVVIRRRKKVPAAQTAAQASVPSNATPGGPAATERIGMGTAGVGPSERAPIQGPGTAVPAERVGMATAGVGASDMAPVPGAEPLPANAYDELELKSDNEYRGGYVVIKVGILNRSKTVMNRCTLDVNYNRKTMRLERVEPDTYEKERVGDKVTIGEILPGDRKTTVEFLLDPLICTGAEIGALFSYTDFAGNPHDVRMKHRRIEVVCPVLTSKTIDPGKLNTASMRDLFDNLAHKTVKALTIPAGLPEDKAFELACEIVERRDVKRIRKITHTQGHVAWYYGRTSKTENLTQEWDFLVNVVARTDKKTLEFLTAADSAAAITGLLSKIGEELNTELERKGFGRPVTKIIQISDSIIYKSTLDVK